MPTSTSITTAAGVSQPCPSSSTQISSSTSSFEKATSLQLNPGIPLSVSHLGHLQHSLPGVISNAADFFELFFSPNVINHIVEQTNLYARQNSPSPSYEWEDCTPDKLKSFWGSGNSNGNEKGSISP